MARWAQHEKIVKIEKQIQTMNEDISENAKNITITRD